MKSMAEILNLVIDGQITTMEQARALVKSDAEELAKIYSMDEDEAQKRLRVNIGYASGYCSHAHADLIMELFETEHPIFGRSHPTAEEALRMGIEMGQRRREQLGQV